ncbi:MAG: efflux RND transporter periplasmic adaptor subunit [Chitinophagales bacterium]
MMHTENKTANLLNSRIAMLVVTAAILLASCSGSELDKKKKELADAKAKVKELNTKIETLTKEIAKMDTTVKVEVKAKLIQIDTLKKQEFKHYIEVQGNVDAEENVLALPQQPGIVRAIYVKEGDVVKKGQLLAITETTGAMEAGILTLQTQLDLATTAFEKQQRLWEQKIGSEIQFLQAKTQKEALEKQMAAQKLQLEMTKVIAPISGTVDAVNLKVGDMAAPSQLMPGIRIVNNNKLSVKAKLADSDYGKVKENDMAQVEFPDMGRTINAPISYVQRTIDARSRTFTVEVKLNNQQGNFAANMIAKLKINDAILKNVLLVPSNVVQQSADGLYVLVAEDSKDGPVARKRLVTTGLDYKGQTVITDGLNEGDRIITFGYSELVDGQRIQF